MTLKDIFSHTILSQYIGITHIRSGYNRPSGKRKQLQWVHIGLENSLQISYVHRVEVECHSVYVLFLLVDE